MEKEVKWDLVVFAAQEDEGVRTVYRDPKETQDNPGRLDHREKLVYLDLKDPEDLWDQLVYQDQLERTALQACQVKEGPQ